MTEKIESVLKKVFKKLGFGEENAKISVSKLEEFDYQINSIFKLVKELKTTPNVVGSRIISEIKSLEDYSDYFKDVIYTDPGFINIVISDKLINEELKKLKEEGNFGIKKDEVGKTVVLDYGGPNVAKPLHVGHLRSPIIGESIKRILNTKGYKTISDVHLGDYGLQLGQVIYGLEKEHIGLNDITLEILEEIYPKMSKLCKEDEEVYKKCAKITKDLQDGKDEYRELWKKICEISVSDIRRIYDYLDVSFDLWYGESDSYKYIPLLIKFLEEKNMVTVDDGAKIVRLEEENDKKAMPPLILQKSDGAYLYQTTDLATIYQRIEDFNPDNIIYVVDERQRLHFEQVFRTCYKSGLVTKARLEHRYNGTVNGPGGKPFKTRSGNLLKLSDLIMDVKENFLSKKEENKNMNEEDINIITNAIIKFAELSNNREKNYIFDIDKFSDVLGKTGPYILYTALRIKKLIRDTNTTNNEVSNIIYNKIDKDLRMKLLDVSNVVDKAAEERMPHFIADYLYDLSVIINSFYQNNNFASCTDKVKLNDWKELLNLSYEVIEFLCNLLVMKIPSKM